MSGGSHTKGAAFRAFFEWCRKDYGESVALSVYREGGAEVQKYLDPDDPHWGIVVSTWYPDSLINRLLERQFESFEKERRLEAIAKATAHATDKTFNGIYRQFVRMILSPSTYTRHVDRLWHLYYDTGTVSGDYSDGQIDFRVSGWQGHHPYRCEITRFSTLEAFKMMGRKDVQVTPTRCISSGASSCDFTVTWDARK